MAVVCTQYNGVGKSYEIVIAKVVDPDHSDAQLLQLKSDSHTAYGWTVTPILGGFDATKIRHGDLCRREFRIV